MEHSGRNAHCREVLSGLLLQESPWDSEQLAISCATIANDTVFQCCPDKEIYQRIQWLLEENKEISFVTFKIPGNCADMLNILVKHLADFVDVELVYRLTALQPVAPSDTVVFVESWDATDFMPLAKEMTWSRFFLEKNISEKTAVRLWQSSITNHCQGRADMLAVCLLENKPAGLVTINFKDQQRLELFMVGVLPEFQGRGVGTSLMQAISQKYGAEYEIFVETSHRNIAANRLYQKTGFSLYDSRYILHAFL